MPSMMIEVIDHRWCCRPPLRQLAPVVDQTCRGDLRQRLPEDRSTGASRHTLGVIVAPPRRRAGIELEQS
jgi:hypothetical protein